MENASVARSLRFRDTTIAFAPRTVQDEAVKEKEEGGGGRGETNAERDEENEERERPVVPWRAIYGTFSIFFSSLFIPAPSLPTILPLPPLLVDTLGARVYVRFLHPLPSSPSTCPFFCRISARFFGPRKTRGGWTVVLVVRWWMATQVEVADDPSFFFTLFTHSLLEATKGRGTPRNYSERKVAANEVAIQAFYHRPIPRPRQDRGGGRKRVGRRLVREGRFIWRGQCRPLLYRHTLNAGPKKPNVPL